MLQLIKGGNMKDNQIIKVYNCSQEPNFSEIQDMISNECDFVKDLLLSKNRKYGNSALNPKRIFSKADPIEQINVRIDDKLSRQASSQYDEDEDITLDLIGYLILRRIAEKLHGDNYGY